MYKNYPYRFRLTIQYRLEGRKIYTDYLIENLETNKTMPFFIGGHPGCNCPLFSYENYDDYYLEFEKEETCSVPKQFPDTGLLDCLNRTPFITSIYSLPLLIFNSDTIFIAFSIFLIPEIVL